MTGTQSFKHVLVSLGRGFLHARFLGPVRPSRQFRRVEQKTITPVPSKKIVEGSGTVPEMTKLSRRAEEVLLLLLLSRKAKDKKPVSDSEPTPEAFRIGRSNVRV